MFTTTLIDNFEASLVSSGVPSADAHRRRRRLEAIQALRTGNPRQFDIVNPALAIRN